MTVGVGYQSLPWEFFIKTPKFLGYRHVLMWPVSTKLFGGSPDEHNAHTHLCISLQDPGRDSCVPCSLIGPECIGNYVYAVPSPLTSALWVGQMDSCSYRCGKWGSGEFRRVIQDWAAYWWRKPGFYLWGLAPKLCVVPDFWEAW